MALKISSLGGVFKTQGMSTQTLLGSMDKWAGRTMGRAAARGSSLLAIGKEQGAMAAFNRVSPFMKSGAMKGAMWGAGLGAAGSIGGDAMNNNLNFGSVGRAIGGGLRGGMMGGMIGGAAGLGRSMGGNFSGKNRWWKTNAALRSRAIRRNAAAEMRLR